MTAMPSGARARYETTLTRAAELVAAGRPREAWPLLETAHLLSQPWRRTPTCAHTARGYTRSFGHTGQMPGYMSWAACLPDDGAVIVVLTNHEVADGHLP